MNDLETAKKVLKDFFGKKIPAKTKKEMEQRLFVAHSLIDSVLVCNAVKGGLAEKWLAELESIEEQINDLRDKVAVQKAVKG
jgi:hypothetical protein